MGLKKNKFGDKEVNKKEFSFVTKDEKACNKYNEIWEVIRKI